MRPRTFSSLLLSLAFLASFAITAVAEAATINVSNSSQLQNAINNAGNGDVIVLANGNYGSLSLTGKNGFTLQAASKHGAVFSTILIKNSSNITVDGVKTETAAAEKWTNIFNIEDSNNIVVENSWSNSTKYRNGNVFRVADSDGVSFINNRASNGTYGFSLRKTSNLLLEGNEVHNFGADAFQYTSFDENHSNITFNENFVHTPDPLNPYNPQIGAHPDGIQFFNTNQGGSVSNVRVTNNVFLANNFTSDKPEWGGYFQGVFFGSECVKGAEVNNNFIYTNMPRGISANGCSTVTANNNTVLPTEAPHPDDFDRIPGYYGVSGNNNVYVGRNGPSGSGNVQLDFFSSDANYFRDCYGTLPKISFNPAQVTNSNAKADCSLVPSNVGFQGNSWTGGGSVPVGTGEVAGGGATGSGGGGIFDMTIDELKNALNDIFGQQPESNPIDSVDVDTSGVGGGGGIFNGGSNITGGGSGANDTTSGGTNCGPLGCDDAKGPGAFDGPGSAPSTNNSNPPRATGAGETPSLTYAIQTPLRGINSFGDFLLAVLAIFIIVATPIVVLFIIIAGFKYVTARGNATQVQEATRAISYALIGGVLILGAVAIVAILTNVVNALGG